ncbi:MAG: hypothetical protein SFU98_12200 [Leptospiraceae bacterium]|nr:hypothetical protein [Leptospiraceae bacterium]
MSYIKEKKKLEEIGFIELSPNALFLKDWLDNEIRDIGRSLWYFRSNIEDEKERINKEKESIKNFNKDNLENTLAYSHESLFLEIGSNRIETNQIGGDLTDHHIFIHPNLSQLELLGDDVWPANFIISYKTNPEMCTSTIKTMIGKRIQKLEIIKLTPYDKKTRDAAQLSIDLKKDFFTGYSGLRITLEDGLVGAIGVGLVQNKENCKVYILDNTEVDYSRVEKLIDVESL